MVLHLKTWCSYECKRSHCLAEVKPLIEVTLEVIDIEEGTGRNEGKLGAVVCEGMDDERMVRVNVGSGFRLMFIGMTTGIVVMLLLAIL